MSSWKGNGRPSLPGRHHFGVEDEGIASKSFARDLGDLGKTLGYFGQAPAPDAHLLAVFVDLHPRAVVFILERGFSVVCFENLLEVLRKLGKHRQQRHE